MKAKKSRVRTLQIVNILTFIFMIIVNYIANIGAFNGKTMKMVSAAYSNYFTPAPYAFAIWGIIYLGLLGFVIYSSRSLFIKNAEDQIVLKVGRWFALSAVANALWLITFLSDYIGASILVMLVIFIALAKIIINTRMELDFHHLKKYVFIYWPFAIYFGWISVALIADIAAWLTKMNWNGFGISPIYWTIVMIIIAGLINLIMIKLRNLREFAAVGIWALIAIAIANKESDAMSIVYTAYIVSAIIFIYLAFSGIKNRPKSIDKF